MTDEPQEHRERRRPGWGWVLLLLSPLLYLASLPFVAMITDNNTFNVLRRSVYKPIEALDKISLIFSSMYSWYLNLFPDWIWD
jgi:hypothetical protein